MTINIYVLKGDLNGKIVVVRFFFLSGIFPNPADTQFTKIQNALNK